MTIRSWALAGVGVLAAGSLIVFLARNRLRRAAQRAVLKFRTRLARYHLQQRRQAKTTLLADPVVREAVEAHAREHHSDEQQVWRRV